MAQKVIVKEKEHNPIHFCEALEKGDILFFEKAPFAFPQDEIDFLLAQKQSGSKSRKNIAYKPANDKITNHQSGNPADAERLHAILRNFSQRVTQFLSALLEPYASQWKLDYASFRPFQEKGRSLRLRARNDLLHCDAFPTRPLHGARILRFFININPTESRRWITSKGFEELVRDFKGQIPFPPSVKHDWKSEWLLKLKQLLKKSGLKVPLRSPYDDFMLRLHHFMKENERFQQTCPKDHWEFPPGACWAVFTDQVSHAALSGQYALEQTFIVPTLALLCPEKAPVSVLERITGKNLVRFELLANS